MSNVKVVKRRAVNREIRHLMYSENALAAIGKIYHGMEIYCLTKGQFSIINILEELLKQTGPANVIISTWTAANAEIQKAESFLENKLINQLHFIVDRSFKTRQPTYCEMLERKFGDAISTTSSHAKFILLENEEWKISIRTSMNLNENKRLENVEISDDPALCEYLREISRDVMKEKFYNYEKFKTFGQDKKYNKFRPKTLFDDIPTAESMSGEIDNLLNQKIKLEI